MIPSPPIDPGRRWRSEPGVREILREHGNTGGTAH
jgi:hypothetical protein